MPAAARLPLAAVSTTLGALLAGAGLPDPPSDAAALAVSDVVYDDRRATAGSVFVAIPGEHTDGHLFAQRAVQRGAVAVVAQRPPEPPLPPSTPLVLVPNTQTALAPLAAELHGHPSRRLIVAGVTGTDGKTTTTTMLQAAWRGAGIAAGSLTTVDFRVLDRVEPNTTRQTTLESADLQSRLRTLLDAGCSHVALETSSHALVLHRVDAVDFACAVFTRITSEHLDFHGSREAYLAAKASLLTRAAQHPDGLAVLDRDDDFAYPHLRDMPVPRRLTYSVSGRPDADLRAEEVHVDASGVHFSARTPWGDAAVDLRMAGRFNVANALAALAAACGTGASLDGAVRGLQGLDRVSGRMERVDLGQPFSVVIDYAHTADALRTVLTELRAATTGRLWAVFGSAGHRDVDKRARMGRVAAELSDRIVVTDEDPREEDRLAIIEQIAAGARDAAHRDGEELLLIPDRTEAIRYAVAHAAPGDTVLLAGKGHESTLITGDGPVPWDERGVAEQAVRKRLEKGGSSL
jgi:UDP-N-acetylmuramoyl-L-alanyl-D-glutamate--2,6-diaminopimelate ligase